MYMLANVVDAIKENTHVFVSAHSRRRPAPPKPVPRPEGTKKNKSKSNLFAAMARTAYLAAEKRKAEENDESGR